MNRLFACAFLVFSLAVSARGSSIGGTVTDSAGTMPLEDIFVTAYQYMDNWWSPVGSANTDSNGCYVIQGLSNATYRIGFEDWQDNYLEEYYMDSSDVYSASNIVLGSHQDLTGIDARLTKAASIAGTVVGPDGAPLAMIQIQAISRDNSYWSYYYHPDATTELDGTYVLKGLRAGTYGVKFSGQSQGYVEQYYGGSYDLAEAADVVIAEGATVGGIDAMLASGGRIAGLASGPSGSPPLDKVTVRTYRRKGSSWREFGTWSWTGFGGNFDYAGLPPGTYRLWIEGEIGDEPLLGEYYDDATNFDQARDLVLAPGATLGNVDAELALACRISGTVVDPADNPVTDASVTVQQFLDGLWVYIAQTNLDANGKYTLAGLSPGTYRVEFFSWSDDLATQWFSNSVLRSTALDIVLGPAATASNVNARLGAASHIAGTVTGPGGAPLDTVEIWAKRLDGGEWREMGSAATADDGTYDIGNLAAGTYRVGFLAWDGNYAPQYYNDVLNIAFALDVVVPGTATVSGINASLSVGCKISGTVTATNGITPLTNVDVVAYCFNGSQWEWVNRTTTDASGFYELEGLPYGQTRLYFADNNGDYVAEWYNDAATDSSAQSIVLSFAGQVLTGYNAALARVPAPPKPQSPELLAVQSTGAFSWSLRFRGELDVDYRLQRMGAPSNGWVDTSAIAIGTGLTNDILRVATNACELLRMRVVP